MLSEPDNQKTSEHRLDQIERAVEAVAEQLRLQRIPLSPLLTAGEVASTLGVSDRTVRRYIDDGLLPTVALDSGRGRRRCLRIQASDLQTFIDARKDKATSPQRSRIPKMSGIERRLPIPDLKY